MNFLVVLLMFISGFSLSVESALEVDNETPPVTSLDFVDVNQYLGRWYQIARNPLPFEPRDCACAQQTLGLQEDGNVSVYNSCNVGGPDGELIEIRGFAVSQNEGNSQFTVDFGLPQTGQYWIVAVEENYKWAVVTDPDRRSLYILSKTPTLPILLHADALIAAYKHTSVDNLVNTDHSNCSYPE